MQCEICGKQINNGIKIKVEGSEMTVCGKCSNLGTKVETKKEEKRYSGSGSSNSGDTKVKTSNKRKSGTSHSLYEEMDELVDDYPKRIQRAREERDLKQDELAQKINEKSSIISKLEKGSKLPEDKVVNKLENFLEIDLKKS